MGSHSSTQARMSDGTDCFQELNAYFQNEKAIGACFDEFSKGACIIVTLTHREAIDGR